jgi:hypothetical protein
VATGKSKTEVPAAGKKVTTGSNSLEKDTAGVRTYAGLFLITLATLMYEVLLTRIFSVTLWYHYGFMVVSMAMFGMAVGAMQVYLDPKYEHSTKYQLARTALLFSAAVVLGFLLHVLIPTAVYRSGWGPIAVALTYGLISIPFGFSGVCVCLALTKFPRQISKLYSADLVGAALGCVLLIYTLKFTDAPTAVVIVAFLASVAALSFLEDGVSRRLKSIATLLSVMLGILAGVNGILAAKQIPALRLKWAKSAIEGRPLYEKWNSFSRVRVYGDPDRPIHPVGWGFSPNLPSEQKARQLALDIDATALTVMTGFHGDLREVDYLEYDVTNLAHHITPNANVLVVGAGGGRDVLSALVFHQKSVTAVEINENIVDAVNRRFGDFTGHLDRVPGVAFVNDEARSYVARSRRQFDLIEVSLVDTHAATAAGAFVLTENSVYTVEAWKSLLEHLSARGILSLSRWYAPRALSETYRVVSLATTALTELGVKKPRGHIAVVGCPPVGPHPELDGIATILVAREPLSEEELRVLVQTSKRMRFDMLLTPNYAADGVFATLAEGGNALGSFLAGFPVNIAAPTDDNPFFFNMLRFRNIFNRDLWIRGREYSNANMPNMEAVSVLAVLLVAVALLTYFFIFGPLLSKTRASLHKGAWPLLIFFSMIGLGYMLVEISQMERLIIFLGHPTYGLSVVLFALLLSGGLGSRYTASLGDPPKVAQAAVLLLLLVVALGVFGKATLYVVRSFQASETPVRLLVAVAILFPLGFLMGMPFPLGMRIASTQSPVITPGLWAVNGATSVLASVLAIAIALMAGISAAFWTGFACYALAVGSYFWAIRGGNFGATIIGSQFHRPEVGRMPAALAPADGTK